MGLDVSHGCWSAPYSQFMSWRSWLHVYITGDPLGTDGYRASMNGDPHAMPWPYADQSVPINVLMNHSDCDGEISAADCGPLADALEALLVKMPERGTYGHNHMRGATLRFIAGLRRAAEAGEAVEFM